MFPSSALKRGKRYERKSGLSPKKWRETGIYTPAKNTSSIMQVCNEKMGSVSKELDTILSPPPPKVSCLNSKTVSTIHLSVGKKSNKVEEKKNGKLRTRKTG